MVFFKSFLLFILFFHSYLYAQNENLEKVTLQLQWKHQFEFAGFYAAKEKGYYRDSGMDVRFKELKNDSSITDIVLSGKAQYGLTYSSIISEYLNGKPLVFVANFFKQSPLVLVAQANIKSPKELKGKRIMGLSDRIHNITLLSMLNQFNIKKGDFINISTNFKLDDFIDKKIDAISIFTTNELYELSQQGIQYTVFDPVVYGAKYYDANLFTSQKELTEHPQRVKKFKDASIKGWEYALSHQEEIINLILKKYNTQNKTKEALRFEAKQIEYIILPKVHPVGSIDKGRVRIIAENFMQAGFIPSGNLNIDHFIYGKRETNSTQTLTINTLYLKEGEKQFLQEKKQITVCVDPNWMPYEKIKNGKHIGIASEYMENISKKLHIPITLVPTKTWDESLVRFKERECDILSLVSPTPTRNTLMSFTTPYYNSSLVIATRMDKAFMSNMKDLNEKKIGIIKGYASNEILQNKYYDIDFIQVDTLREGLEKVANGDLYGVIDSLTTISYQIQQRFPTQLKIAGQLNEKLTLGIATHKDDIQLLRILNNAIDSISDTSKSSILNHWVSVQFDRPSTVKDFWKITAPILLIFILLLLSQYALSQYNRKLKKQVHLTVDELREKDEILLQKQRMADMGEMLSMIAHQWKQPLGAINSTISGIHIKIASGKYNLDHPAEQEAFLSYLEKKFTNINEYVHHLSTTTDDFRNFFNPNKSKELTSLSTPIENALNIVEDSLQEKGIEIIKDLQANPTFDMYSNEIMQVILNLLKNSEYNFLDKHTREPKIIIATFLKKDKTIISICDNGGGIPANIAKKIFAPYFSTKSEKNGTGLGLYMSKIIIEDHHYGTLTMKNHNDGVCFEMMFKT